MASALGRRSAEAPPASPAAAEPGTGPSRLARLRERLGPELVLAAPAAGIVALSFDKGGFFSGTVGLGAALAAAALAVRGAFARRPFAGLGAWAVAAAVLLAAFGAWALASAAWSDAPARAIAEADRVLLYLLTLVLVACAPRTARTPGSLVGWLAAAMVVVCGAGLASRVLPELLTTAPNVVNSRLSYPLTYWNALGLMAAVALVLCFHLAAGARRVAIQALGTAAMPLLAATLVLTFSRGSALVAALALAAYALLGRPPGLLGAAIAAGPAVAVAAHAALTADLLAEADYSTPAAVAQGAHVARVVAVAALLAAAGRVLLAPLDAAVGRLLRRRANRRIAWGAAAVAGAAVIAVSLAAGAGGVIAERVDEFRANERVIEPGQPLRERFSSASSHDRVLIWEAALEEFRQSRLTGNGAGTFPLVWLERRPEAAEGRRVITVTDGHSLYLEVLAELGLPGLLLLALALGVSLVAVARLARGRERAAWTALLVAAAAWALHAAGDWDWEMAAVTLFVFAAAGAALARPEPAVPEGAVPTALRVRVPAVAACAVLAVVPLQMWRSQVHLDRSVKALMAADCGRALPEARAAREALGVRAEPNEVIGICLARAGEGRAAVRALEAAVRRDPGNWEIHYELALVRGMAGLDPRQAARTALRLNPHEELAIAAVRRLRTSRPDVWRRRALNAPLPGLAPPPGPDAAVLPSAGGPAAAPPPPAERRRG